MTPALLPARLARRIAPASGCWIWTGARQSRGYGCTSIAGKRALVHRVAYQALVGPIPDDLQIDHLCRVKACCNPAHLEPVTGLVNRQRAAALVTECRHGHPFTPENTYRTPRGARECRTCRSAQFVRRRAAGGA